MAIEVTEYERVLEGDTEKWARRVRAQRLPPIRHVVKTEQGIQSYTRVPMPKERWIVTCVQGPVYIWNHQAQRWELAHLFDLWDFAMTKDEALKLLETVEPVKR